VDWLDMCVKFRSSGMPLETIRKYTELIRQGTGNEQERLDLLRSHQQHVAEQIEELTECLRVITYKVDIYTDHLNRGTAGTLWVGPGGSPDTCEETA
jgi:DNA-binding transcriptional MerR regulator